MIGLVTGHDFSRAVSALNQCGLQPLRGALRQYHPTPVFFRSLSSPSNRFMPPLQIANRCRVQGLKPTVFLATKVVPCYKAHSFNILHRIIAFQAGANIDAFALASPWPLGLGLRLPR